MKTMTPEQQSSLVAQAKAGNRRAQEQLLRFCERDILAMVAKVKCAKVDREDLAQVARMAVLKAVQTFRADAGKQFRFYAADWAREDIRRYSTTLPSVVTRNVRTRSSQDVALDAPVHSADGDDDITLLDLMESEALSPEDSVIVDDENERLRQVLERIIRRLKAHAEAKYDRLGLCRDLVYNRLLSHDPVNLDTLSQRYGVARETVRKLEVAIMKMAKQTIPEV